MRPFDVWYFTGEWNGMVRMLKDNKADIGAAPFSVMKQRAEAIDFGHSFTSIIHTFLVAR